jgi:glycerophosphoryl diester phosphodiesterase
MNRFYMKKFSFLAIIMLFLRLPGFSQPFYLIAHRGGIVDSTNVENSLPALDAAIKQGYRMIEMDIRLTKDSVLIINHDKDFKRYYDVDSNVADMTWKQISRLVSDRGSKVVSLEEEFRHCRGHVQVMLDNKIKGNDTVVWKKLIDLLKRYDLLDSAITIGTDESAIWFTGKIRLSATRRQLEENSLKPGYKSTDYYLFGGVKNMTAADVEWARQQGIMVIGAVNMFAYKSGGLPAAFIDIETLKFWGVSRFQIDSELGTAFHELAESKKEK